MNKPLFLFPGHGASFVRAFSMVVVAVLALGTAAAQAATSAAIVVDAKTGKVLYSSNADTRAYPASLTKMMTLYMLFEALDSGRTTLDSRIKVSAHAAAQPPSKLGLKAGSTISVKDAILSLVTRSANDIAAAIGEHLGGTESGFAVMMTNKARALGMSSTTFRNASGLPNSSQVTTARDMARLGRALQDRFPRYFDYFKTRSFSYAGQKIGNHNRLLGKVEGVDGIKTGYTRASGFNLVTSVNRSDRRIVAVVLGGTSGSARDQRMAGLIKEHIGKASTGLRIAAPILPGPVEVAGIPEPRLRPVIDVETGSVATAAAVVARQEIGQGDIGEDDSALAAGPAVTSPIGEGWKIQIAAAPSRASALALLETAKSEAPAVLASVSPYTEPVVKNSVTLHRARFGGFTDKKAARDACAYLTERDFACIALSD